MTGKMNILFVGDLNEYGRSFQRFRVLKDLGHEVRGLSFSPNGYTPGISKPIPLIEKIAYKLGVPLDKTDINNKIIRCLTGQKVDLLWIGKGLVVKPGTLRKVRKIQPFIKMVSYSEDDMYAPHNRSLYYTWGLKYYDVVFTTKSYNCNPDELPALGARKVMFVDKAFDRYTHRPFSVTDDEKIQLGADVGFIGTFESYRGEAMLFLANNEIPVRIWGNGWGGWMNTHPNLKVENHPIFDDEYVKALCTTKINLCFLRKANRDLQTDRTMEIPACGAFMLAERTDEHLRLFEEGKEAAFFNSDNFHELLEKVRYYLRHEDERRKIAVAGRERCLKSGYSHHDRLRYMLDIVKYEINKADFAKNKSE